MRPGFIVAMLAALSGGSLKVKPYRPRPRQSMTDVQRQVGRAEEKRRRRLERNLKEQEARGN